MKWDTKKIKGVTCHVGTCGSVSLVLKPPRKSGDYWRAHFKIDSRKVRELLSGKDSDEIDAVKQEIVSWAKYWLENEIKNCDSEAERCRKQAERYQEMLNQIWWEE